MKLPRNLASAALIGALAAAPALADFPERNIENIYPWNPGATMAASQVIADAMGEELGVNISVVSRHLALMRDAGILEAQKQGKEVFYSVRYSVLAGTLRAIADAMDACCRATDANPGRKRP